VAILHEAQRKKFATIGKDRYPINDKAHARAALGRINQGNLSSSQKATVRARAHSMLQKGPKMSTGAK
jgi:hypothetical protein